MSHAVGTLQTIAPVIIGPDTGAAPSPAGTWAHNFSHTPASGGSKFLILHFQNASLPASNRLEVDLGYGTDIFTSADGSQFWTRPVNLHLLPAGQVPIRYITSGATSGSVHLDRYGRGERLPGVQDPSALSNCDPFLGDAIYTEPIYDPFWYCADPPNWENVACVPPDIRSQVARSAGMIVSIHDGHVSTCSVTLVDGDKVITAGHCITAAEAESASVVFDYQTQCDGSRPPAYNPHFHKVADLMHRRWDGTFDYALLRLRTAPPGIPAIQLRHDIPAAGEQMFGIHHPNGAVKKLSIPHPGFTTVQNSGTLSITVPSQVHVTGGSSGSGLFDLAGRIVGVLSRGNPCGNGGPPTSLIYFPTGSFLTDIAPTPPPPVTRDVMLVFDRSGSMVGDDGTGRSKIVAARDAVSLFVQLVQAGTGNRIGLVSFASTASSPVDFAITNVTNASKHTLIGPAPYAGGQVGSLAPGGMTTIGGGLEAARIQFPAPGANPRAMLLLTDGMQNTPPMIADVEGALGGIELNAIGFGTESNLDGDLLTTLAGAHDGLYMRAGNGLALQKFFTEAFGNIFVSGVLFDPEFDLPANQSGEPQTFPVCGEEAITAVAGWDRDDAQLLLEFTTPGGAVITATTAGVETATGRTWTFLRLPLPHGGERDGLWKVRVVRPAGSGEFPPPTPGLRYFVSVVPTGGPRLVRVRGTSRRHYYTGDFFNPMVQLLHADGSRPHNAEVRVTLTRPDRGTGNILTDAGLGAPGILDGDTMPARLATLQAMESASGQPVVRYIDIPFILGDRPADTGGMFESNGLFGKAMPEQLTVEGNYTLHAKATYGHECAGAREVTWSFSVAVGIDPGHTGTRTDPTGPGPGGTECMRVTFTPRDRYGNHLGPGRVADFTIEPQPGTTIEAGVTDLGNGSYQVDMCWDPASGDLPSFGISQPGRPTAVVTPSDIRRYVYSVKFLCGEQSDACCECAPVRPGHYATEINIHNHHDHKLSVVKQVIPLVLVGAVRGREPQVAGVAARERLVLPGHSATMDDCCRIMEMLLGGKPAGPLPLTIGLLELSSPVELSVTAVYTATDLNTGSVSIDVETVSPKPRHPTASN
jgi:hypothetical protein